MTHSFLGVYALLALFTLLSLVLYLQDEDES